MCRINLLINFQTWAAPHQLWSGNYSPDHQSSERGKYKYFWRRDGSSIGGINIRMMLISELWQGSVTAWGWPHRDIPCHHDTSLRWSRPQLTPRINIVISDGGTTPRALGATTNNKMRIRSWKQIVSSGRGDWVLTLASYSLSLSELSILYWSVCLWCWLPGPDVGRTLYFKQWQTFNWDLENNYIQATTKALPIPINPEVGVYKESQHKCVVTFVI